MSDYDWVTRPRNYASEAKESYLDVEDATDDHPLVEEGAAEDGGDDVRLSHLHILKQCKGKDSSTRIYGGTVKHVVILTTQFTPRQSFLCFPFQRWLHHVPPCSIQLKR